MTLATGVTPLTSCSATHVPGATVEAIKSVSGFISIEARTSDAG
jgi:hypothetical protein